MRFENGKVYFGQWNDMAALIKQTDHLGYWSISILTKGEVRKLPVGTEYAEHAIPDMLAWVGFQFNKSVWTWLPDYPVGNIAFDERHNLRGYVYFARNMADGLVKIGYSHNPIERIKCFGPDMRLLAVYPGGMHDEKEIHKQLARMRHEGEWFRYSIVIKRFVREHAYVLADDECFRRIKSEEDTEEL